MSPIVVSLLHSLQFTVRSRASLHLEIMALRHQLAVVHRSRRPRLRLSSVDRMLWAWLAHAWSGWRAAVHIVTPDTVVAWHRRGFRLFWTWKSRHRSRRPAVPRDVRALIRDMSTANPLWVRRGFTFRLLFVLVILAHDRRRIVHVAVTDHPTAAWTVQQVRNAFSEHETPRYLLHDRDSVFAHVATTIERMNIQEVRTAP